MRLGNNRTSRRVCEPKRPESIRAGGGIGESLSGNMSRFGQTSILIALAMLIAGCDGDPSRGSVTGLVTIDGRPVSEGRITFYPTAGTSGPVAG